MPEPLSEGCCHDKQLQVPALSTARRPIGAPGKTVMAQSLRNIIVELNHTLRQFICNNIMW